MYVVMRNKVKPVQWHGSAYKIYLYQYEKLSAIAQADGAIEVGDIVRELVGVGMDAMMKAGGFRHLMLQRELEKRKHGIGSPKTPGDPAVAKKETEAGRKTGTR